MEQQQTSYLKTVMYFGLITGGILIGFAILLQLTGLKQNSLIANLSIVIFAACIYFTGKIYRDKYLDGYITYTQALGFGFLTGLFAAILLSFFAYLAVKFEPSIIDKQLEYVQEEMLKKGIDDDSIERATNVTRKLFTPAGMFFTSILAYGFFSLIISLVSSAMLKKERDPFARDTEDFNN